MNSSSFKDSFQNVWNDLPVDSEKTWDILYLVTWGFFIGALTGAVISIFRITTNIVYEYALLWTSAHRESFAAVVCWLLIALAAAAVVGFLIRNPAIRFGGRKWIQKVMNDGQPHSWAKILFPKFLGSWLVMAVGTSVGHEGPSIQMGAATALGLKKFDPKYTTKRRFFILGGCAAGLSAAFSTPFAGICYVYEIMKEKISGPLFLFMMAGSFGVYFACSLLFGLDLMLPVGAATLPDLANFWLVVPLGIFAGIVGIAYNYALRCSIALYGMQKILSRPFRPVLSFLATAFAVLYFPAVTGEGLSIFATLESGGSIMGYLTLFLCVKLLLTAFCYGSGIPAGLMVPLLCIGGVAGGIYANGLFDLGLIPHSEMLAFILMGMAGTFAAAERAPITAIVITAQMTGAYETLPGLLLAAAIGSLCGRVAKVRSV